MATKYGFSYITVAVVNPVYAEQTVLARECHMTSRQRDRSAAVIVGGGPGRDYPTVRSLSERGVRTIYARTDEKSPVPASRFCDETVDLPSPTTGLAAFRDALLGLAARRDVATVIPSREDSVYILSKYADRFSEHVSLVVPPFETLRRAHDRLRLAEAATAAGVPVPETKLLSDVEDWDTPSIVKSRFNILTPDYVDGFPSNEVAMVKSVQHLDPGERPDIDAIRAEMRHEPIVQEFVPTDGEFMFAGLYDHGEALATFQHRQVRGDSYLGGGGVYRKSIYDEELQQVADRLLRELDWHGLACIEYMRDANTGEFVLTEINPRTWQSLSAAVRAGADFPYNYWLAAMGEADSIDPSYDLGVGTHSLYGEFEHLHSLFHDRSPHAERPPVVATLGAILASLYAEPAFDYTRLDDPGPLVSSAAFVCRNLR
jgi:predicted ATP-grasp superfamily ATP-dependent carboligase